MKRGLIVVVLIGAAAVAAWFAYARAGTQSASPRPAAHAGSGPAAADWKPPRTPDGRPDLQGYWDALEYVDGRRRTSPFALDVQAHVKNAWWNEHPSLVVDPADGGIPYQEWAAKKRRQLVSTDFIEYIGGVDPHVKCFRNAPPRQIYAPGGVQILQSAGQVVIVHEWDANYRVVPTDGRPHIGKSFSLYVGDSRGRWEEDTLVVDTTNLNGNAWLSANGDFTSPDLRLVERFTMLEPDRIHYQVTLDAPSMYSRPWTMAFRLVRLKDPGYQHIEFACREGEKSLQNIQEAHPGAQHGRVFIK